MNESNGFFLPISSIATKKTEIFDDSVFENILDSEEVDSLSNNSKNNNNEEGKSKKRKIENNDEDFGVKKVSNKRFDYF